MCYHAWYLDDGVFAGPSSHVRKALTLFLELGPPLGLHVNIKKCEVFSNGSLVHFPSEMKQSSKPNLEILGIPIGDADFCSAVLERKRSEASFLLKFFSQPVFQIFDQDVQKCFTSCTGVHSSKVAWKQFSVTPCTSSLYCLIMFLWPGFQLSCTSSPGNRDVQFISSSFRHHPYQLFT